MPAPKDIDFYENPFGYELRRHRERLGKTGHVTPTEDFAHDCDTLFETHGMMKRLAQRVRKQSGLPRWAREWFEAEQEAHRLRNWQPLIVPGLLQSAEYSHELLRTHPGMTQERIEQLGTARMERKRILDRRTRRRCGSSWTRACSAAGSGAPRSCTTSFRR